MMCSIHFFAMEDYYYEYYWAKTRLGVIKAMGLFL